ncbi:BnaC03g13200D [Brassica napus]|uniref:BnaC03g13200D protein n=1 Tax=Brassica napus TaxID=3708 RepID=A0A078FFZ9_BRANA|nr:BnaC03g13200D [Brassica napus]
MVVRLRLSRLGCKNRPSLSYFNPLPGQDGGKRMGLKFDRIKYWLSVGAQASNPVQRLLFRSGLLPPPPMVAMGHKGGERDTHVVDPTTGRCVDAERKPPVMDNELKEEENAEDKSP